MTDSNDVTYDGCPTGVYVVPGPDARIDFEQSIAKVAGFDVFRVSKKALIQNACLFTFARSVASVALNDVCIHKH